MPLMLQVIRTVPLRSRELERERRGQKPKIKEQISEIG
jgi:hypothetical protein